MTMRLKLCPFCRGGAHIREIRSCDRILYSVSCNKVGCYGFEPMACFPSPEEAAKEWNRRAERTCRNVCEWNKDTFHFTCSECGAEIGGDDWGDSPLFVGDYHEQLRYCPNCGARLEDE